MRVNRTQAQVTSQTLIAGAGYNSPIIITNDTASYAISPGGGGTINGQFTLDDAAGVLANPNGADWHQLTNANASSVQNSDTLFQASAVRFSATGKNGTVRVSQ